MLEIGIKAPLFTLQDTFGNDVSLSNFLGKKVVLYFYPKDSTSGCTAQALSFKALYEEYKALDVVILGVSKDSLKSHVKFVEKYDLPFILLSDEALDVIKMYDVWGEKKLYGKPYMGVIRTTYVIDENGFIIDANNKVKAASNGDDVLQLIKKLK